MKKVLEALGFNSKMIAKVEALKDATEISDADLAALSNLKTEYIETDIKPNLDLPDEAAIRKDEQNKQYTTTINSLKAHAKRVGVEAAKLEGASKAQDIISLAVNAAKAAAGEGADKGLEKLRADLAAAQDDLFSMKSAKEAAEAAKIAAEKANEEFEVNYKTQYAQKETIRAAINDNFVPADNASKETIAFQKKQIQQYIENNVGELKEDGTILSKDGTVLKAPSGKEVWQNLNEAVNGFVQVAGIGKVVNTRKPGTDDVIITAGDGEKAKSFNMSEAASALEKQMAAKFGDQ